MILRNRMGFTQSHMLLIAMGASLVVSMAATFAAATRTAHDDPAERHYRPMQSIGYDLGTQRATGYFIRDYGTCRVTLLLAEAAGAPARLRLALRPGQSAGLDSEAGETIDMTCGEAAETLAVRHGSDATRQEQAAR